VKDFEIPLAPEYPGPCAVPLLMDALLLNVPKFSMISTSPQFGQPTVPIFSPSIQKAGQMPFPNGSLILASILPYCQLRSAVCVDAPGLPVWRRADVYWPEASRIARMTRLPLPS
jgi:hypothetical protein